MAVGGIQPRVSVLFPPPHCAGPPLRRAGCLEEYAEVVATAEQWLTKAAGGVTPDYLAPAIARSKDRTFSVPILTHCALVGKGRWKIIQLPFELAAAAQLVCRASPASGELCAARAHCHRPMPHQHRPSWNPFTRVLRNAAREKTLQVLEQIQPSNGGFLEATPLTSFVTMSLTGCGLADHPVARKGIEFYTPQCATMVVGRLTLIWRRGSPPFR